MKILVTGGAGFIGSHIVDRYITEGHEVAVIDDLSFGKKENVNPAAKFYKADLSNREEILAIFEKEKPEVVNHHAALASVIISTKDPNITFKTNVLGTLNILEAGGNVGAKKIIFASTCALFGVIETKDLPVSENALPNPISPYALSKLIGERVIKLIAPMHGMHYIIFRYGNVYGPRQNPKGEAGVIAIFAGQILEGQKPTIFGDGTKTRDYVYIDDIVAANVKALDFHEDNVFHLGWGKEVQDIEIFRAVARALGNENREPTFAPARPGEAYRISLNSGNAKTKLGWAPKIPFTEGVERTVKYIEEMHRKE